MGGQQNICGVEHVGMVGGAVPGAPANCNSVLMAQVEKPITAGWRRAIV